MRQRLKPSIMNHTFPFLPNGKHRDKYLQQQQTMEQMPPLLPLLEDWMQVIWVVAMTLRDLVLSQAAIVKIMVIGYHMIARMGQI
jgi:hypothetical protein